MCGGFIWDWVDQAIDEKRVNKDYDGFNLLYGTDFEKDEPRHWYSPINTTAMTGSNTYFAQTDLSRQTEIRIRSISRFNTDTDRL